ncbi:GntR family transcriptional regulator [Nocardia jiangxiensis]|uniref:GntR family transcriptional regulator n=1 Tax=Nocardia jiangxiensis TaxID=282685 RepID=A0ABW6S0X3_9NOCA
MDEFKYHEIARQLAQEIRAMPDGHRVPSEHEIAQRFGVARSTARGALQELSARNVIRRVRGAGSFASHRIDYRIDADRAPSWSATVREAGAVPRSVVRSCTVEFPDDEQAAKLRLDPGEHCHRLVRLSYVNDRPAAWGVEWIPARLVPDLAAAMRVNDSLHEVLINFGLTPQRAWVRATAEIFAPEVATHLDAPTSSLGWYVESLNTDTVTDRPVSLTHRWLRADTVRVIFESAVHPHRP